MQKKSMIVLKIGAELLRFEKREIRKIIRSCVTCEIEILIDHFRSHVCKFLPHSLDTP